jgi:hypothetical protein
VHQKGPRDGGRSRKNKTGRTRTGCPIKSAAAGGAEAKYSEIDGQRPLVSSGHAGQTKHSTKYVKE